MNNKQKPQQIGLWDTTDASLQAAPKKVRKSKAESQNSLLPEKLGKAIRLPMPDFSDPKRKLTCLEADFPIAQINALSNLEGNAGKPIYQMSKWWARRRSSVFRSMLIAAATTAPDDPNEAAKLVWDHYYCNHQKAGSFKKLRVLDCFMGGGTSLVEGSRLGMQMTGVDLNPVAWFVVKNELACSDPAQVKALFEHIEKQVKPQIQAFYTTTCPRGHKGKWFRRIEGRRVEGSITTDGSSPHSPILLPPVSNPPPSEWEAMPEGFDPIDLPPEERKNYRWEGPEVIYTFWAKHGPCQAKGCGHRTPIFRTPVIAEKKLSTGYAELTCPGCGTTFHAELGEIRMAPGAERVVLEGDTPFTELSQIFARLLNDYDKGNVQDTIDRLLKLKETVAHEPGLHCPACGIFAGKRLADVIERHAKPSTTNAQRKKKDLALKKKSVQMYLLIHPEWLKGASGVAEEQEGRSEEVEGGRIELGGYAGAPAELTSKWFESRIPGTYSTSHPPTSHPPTSHPPTSYPPLIEVRGASLPDRVTTADGSIIDTGQGTVPKQAQFTCASCGKSQDRLSATKRIQHTAPVAAYTLQCHCPHCEAEGYTYGGRYFKAPDVDDIRKLSASEREWQERKEIDLAAYWPRMEIPFSMRTHVKDPLPDHGYTHWWMLFNNRQLLVHACLLKAITEAPEDAWPLDIREQVLGAFQQYLRNQNMFCFWDTGYDKLVPFMSNANYNPKNLAIENSVFKQLGRGNWSSNIANTLDGIEWMNKPWEAYILPDESQAKSEHFFLDDPIIPGNEPYCGSSTDLSMLANELFDLVITDPPFGDNLYYADLADFFYVWLRLPLRQWYAGLPEAAYFEPERTPHSMEAVDNSVEHPDDREDYEKKSFITLEELEEIEKKLGGRHD